MIKPVAAPIRKGQPARQDRGRCPRLQPVETPLVAATDVDRMGPVRPDCRRCRAPDLGKLELSGQGSATGAARPLYHGRRRGGGRQIDPGRCSCRGLGTQPASRRRAHARARRLGRARRRSASCCSKAPTSAGTRSARLCCSMRRGATMSMRLIRPALDSGAVGRLRPLSRFRRSPIRAMAAALPIAELMAATSSCARRFRARSDFDPRSAGRGGAGARGRRAGAAATASSGSTMHSTSGCAPDFGRSPPRIPALRA